jgi:hypothetical protein
VPRFDVDVAQEIFRVAAVEADKADPVTHGVPVFT